MPLLPLEPFVFPDDLLTGSADAAGPDTSWWVLHTRPRAEKSLARKLRTSRTEFFLPLYRKQWRSQGRLLSSHPPPFPGYVFLRGDGEARLKALQTSLVANVLPVPDGDPLGTDLARVYRVMLGEAPLVPEDRLPPGALVELVAGPLEGLVGKVLRRGKELR